MAWLHINFNSLALRMPATMDVLIPQYTGEKESIRRKGPFQTLYLLHGLSGDSTSWLRETAIERYAKNAGIAVVMPAAQNSFYTDMVYGRDYFTFITEELPALCERLFPLSPVREDRFIAGLSMGGYGALKAGLLKPEVFSMAASFSGAVDIVKIADEYTNTPAKERLTNYESFFGDIFGSLEELEASNNNLMLAAERLSASNRPKAELYMWCGTEDFLYEGNVKMRDCLQRLGLPLCYEEGPGCHDWQYWDRCAERIINGWLRLKPRKGGE